jgi:PAS domain-containing protein
MTPLARRHILTWFVPVLTVGTAFLLTRFVPTFRSQIPLFLFLTTVLISTWVGGWVSGLVATLLSGLITAWFAQSPEHAFFIANSDDLLRWVVFVLIALMISSLHASRGKAEQRQRQSEQRLSLAIDSARLGVWDYNLITRHFWWSKTLEVIYGRTEGNFPRTYGQFFGCIHFDDQPLFNRAITRTIDEGTDYEIEHRILLPDRSVRWVNTRGRVFFNQASRAERIVGVTTDITRRKMEIESRLFRQNEFQDDLDATLQRTTVAAALG